MKIDDLSFELPHNSIALRPLRDRASSRLLRVSRGGDIIIHSGFRELSEQLREGDLLIMNDSKVLPVRLRVNKTSGGVIDLILIREISEGVWEILCIGRYSGKVTIDGKIQGEISIDKNSAMKTITFKENVRNIIDKFGLMPLPPYIKRLPDELDRTDYQTVYASQEGSIAAPTAGLHFTESIIRSLKEKGVEIETLTLHIGRGTFMPIKSKDAAAHKMESERFTLKTSLIDKIHQYKKMGRRIIAVGTTTTRTLEGVFSGRYLLEAPNNGVISGSTDIFIYPGYTFRAIDGMITNFHLPRSTPLMLVAALLGIENTRKIYNIAIQKGYRFFSYGDAMLIL